LQWTRVTSDRRTEPGNESFAACVRFGTLTSFPTGGTRVLLGPPRLPILRHRHIRAFGLLTHLPLLPAHVFQIVCIRQCRVGLDKTADLLGDRITDLRHCEEAVQGMLVSRISPLLNWCHAEFPSGLVCARPSAVRHPCE